MKAPSQLAAHMAKSLASLGMALTFLLTSPAIQAQTAVQAAPRSAELRVGVFLDADSLPLIAAAEKGLFAKEGVNVKLVTFQNPVERDAALQAGAVDGVVSDLLAAVLAVKGGFELRVTSLTDGRYGLVAGPGSGLTSVAQLKGVDIASSLNSIVHYAAESFLAQAGVASADMKILAVPKMPVRLEMLLAGQVKAACLPEPLLSAARARGATLLAASDDGASGGASGFGAGVLLFTKKSLDTRLDDVRAFYRAYAAACALVNADNDAWRPFLAQKVAFPADLVGSYRFVLYRAPREPSEADLARAQAWLVARGLVARPFPASALLDPRAIAGL